MTRARSRRPGTAAGLVAAAVVLSGCTVGSVDQRIAATSTSTTLATDLVAEAEARTLIDVRTADEVAAGAIEGALHLDIQDPDFEDLVAELPRDEAYLVYCRTGNRSGQAIDRMRALGFDDLVNGGAYEDLVDAGLPSR